MTAPLLLAAVCLSIPFALGCRDIVLWAVDVSHNWRRARIDRVRRRRLGLRVM